MKNIVGLIEEQLERLGWGATNETPTAYCVSLGDDYLLPYGWVKIYDDWNEFFYDGVTLLEHLISLEEDAEYADFPVGGQLPSSSRDWPSDLISFEQIEEGLGPNDNPCTLITISTNKGIRYCHGPHGVDYCTLEESLECDDIHEEREDALSSQKKRS